MKASSQRGISNAVKMMNSLKDNSKILSYLSRNIDNTYTYTSQQAGIYLIWPILFNGVVIKRPKQSALKSGDHICQPISSPTRLSTFHKNLGHSCFPPAITKHTECSQVLVIDHTAFQRDDTVSFFRWIPLHFMGLVSDRCSDQPFQFLE